MIRLRLLRQAALAVGLAAATLSAAQRDEAPPAPARAGTWVAAQLRRFALPPRPDAVAPRRSAKAALFVAVPVEAATRDAQGRLTVFVTRDGRTFRARTVQAAGAQAGYYALVEGLGAGERVACDGAPLRASPALAASASP
ncbi:MAG: HlyD family secretion protein [Pelomonas sp.]|nr:HlyD family secretion protein [Roseateles sp.]